MRGILLRPANAEQAGGERSATPLELFFDLCFVVAVAEVASVFHSDPTLEGTAIAAGLFVPVWWAWMAFTWHATAYDADDGAHRLATLLAMLGVLGLATAVSEAADGKGATFALAAAGLRLPLLWLWLRAHHRASREMCGFSLRYILGTSWAIALWAVSATFAAPIQQALWVAATVGEIAAPYAAVRTAVRAVYDRAHIVERYGLFTIIVLGESVLAVVTGTSLAGLDFEASATAVLGFAAAAGIWWLYFDRVGAAGLGTSRRAGFTWGYGHLAVWAAIAALGVGTELGIERTEAEPVELAAAEPEAVRAGEGGGLPLEVMPLAGAVALVALAVIGATSTGPAMRRAVRTRLAAAAALAIVAALAGLLSPPAVAFCVAIVLAVTAASDRAGALIWTRREATPIDIRPEGGKCVATSEALLPCSRLRRG